MTDLEIARVSRKRMKRIVETADGRGIEPEGLTLYGDYIAKLSYEKDGAGFVIPVGWDISTAHGLGSNPAAFLC